MRVHEEHCSVYNLPVPISKPEVTYTDNELSQSALCVGGLISQCLDIQYKELMVPCKGESAGTQNREDSVHAHLRRMRSHDSV